MDLPITLNFIVAAAGSVIFVGACARIVYWLAKRPR